MTATHDFERTPGGGARYVDRREANDLEGRGTRGSGCVHAKTLPRLRAHRSCTHGPIYAEALRAIARSRNQTKASGLGGFSRREARRGGRTHREEGEVSESIATGMGCPKSMSVADLQKRVGSPEGTLGSPDSPQGAALRQGVVSAKGSAAVGAAIGGVGGVAFDFRGLQQHEWPRQRSPHLQLCASDSAVAPTVAWSEAAAASLPPSPRPITSKVAASSHRALSPVQECRGQDLTRTAFRRKKNREGRLRNQGPIIDSKTCVVKLLDSVCARCRVRLTQPTKMRLCGIPVCAPFPAVT